MKRRVQIGVVGAGDCDRETGELAYQVGRLVAEHGAVLITGGLEGVMEAASRGAVEAGGTTVGILPGASVRDANPYVEIPVATGLSHARNVVLVQSCDAVVAVSGGYGTLSEVALALKMGKPVITINGWERISGVQTAQSPAEAVKMAFKSIS